MTEPLARLPGLAQTRHQSRAIDGVMTTVNLPLSAPLKQFVDEEVSEGGFASEADYLRDLIRQRQRAKAEQVLRRLIAEGLASGPAQPLEAEFFDDLRERARLRAGQ